MKISVNRALPIFVHMFVGSIQKSAIILVVIVLGLAFLLAGSTQIDGPNAQTIAFFIGCILLCMYWVSQAISARLHVKGTYIELSSSQVSGEKTGFSSNSFTVPIQKITTMYVEQDFIDKLFGVSAIVFTQMNSAVSVYGVDYTDAQKFVKKFANLQSKK